jgi:hypothetical protein
VTGKTRDDGANIPREYQPDEVEALTLRASQLLDELHTVMAEMSDRLRNFLGEDQQ